jgi:NAD(P)-dependent dehydrogenase (short-subunit alcohol dehydrogenase family)
MSLYGIIRARGKTGFGYSSTAEEVTEALDLKGKTILVTGCNSGLGFETMRVLCKRGAHVIATARTLERAAEATQLVNGKTTPLACELSDPYSIRSCIEEIRSKGISLDVIIANAGIMALPTLQVKHGFELQFFTNHMGHFMLVTGLLDLLTDFGRVVILSSDAHKAAPKRGIEFDNLDGKLGYSPWTAYGQSKLANLLFAKELARRFKGTHKTANALHPGVIRTNLGRSMNPFLINVLLKIVDPLFLKSIPEGAATQCFAAAHPASAGINGQYLADCNIATPSLLAQDADLAKKLWEHSENLAKQLELKK